MSEERNFCPACGYENFPGKPKCTHCGHQLMETEEAVQREDGHHNQDENKIGTILKALGVLIFTLGGFLGLFAGLEGHYNSNFIWLDALLVWVLAFITGMLFIGFGEIIHLLNKIYLKNL